MEQCVSDSIRPQHKINRAMFVNQQSREEILEESSFN